MRAECGEGGGEEVDDGKGKGVRGTGSVPAYGAGGVVWQGH